MERRRLTLGEVAKITGGTLEGNPLLEISGVADLGCANNGDISAYYDRRYEAAVKATSAGAICISTSLPKPEGHQLIICKDPNFALQQIVEILYDNPARASGFEGIHPSAVIHPTSLISEGVTIGPHAIIDAHCKIGKGSWIGAATYVGPECEIGEACILDPHVVLRQRCKLGKRVVIQSGTVIGTCGYGFHTDKLGHHHQLTHIGTVTIEDDVTIGANSTIDRARFATTRISRGSKIDNLVLIGHNVTVGEDNFIVGQTGVAGGTKTGKHVVLAGHVAVTGHISIGDGVMITGKSGVSKSVEKPGKYRGVPVQPMDEYNRNAVLLRNIHKLASDVQKLKKEHS